MFSKSKALTGYALLIFVLCLAVGSWLAVHKPLWNDEIFSQVSQIEKLSYAQMIFFHPGEGNVCPLFYLIQKGVCDLFSFKLPVVWNGQSIVDLRSQLILRLASDVCMSASIAVIFYFFARYFSWGLGFYALGTAFSCAMVWDYWVEARHYPLWFLLTTVQLLIFVLLLKRGKEGAPTGRALGWLAVAQVLLAFTVILSVEQILVVSFLVWFFIDRRWRAHLWLTLVPLAICLLYFVLTPRYAYYFCGDALELLGLTFHAQWLWVLGLYACVCLAQRHLRYAPVFLLSLILLGMAWLWLTYYQMTGVLNYGGALTYRYLIHLSAIGIIAVVCFSWELWLVLKGDRLARGLLVMVLGCVLGIRLLKTYTLVLGWYVW